MFKNIVVSQSEAPASKTRKVETFLTCVQSFPAAVGFRAKKLSFKSLHDLISLIFSLVSATSPLFIQTRTVFQQILTGCLRDNTVGWK